MKKTILTKMVPPFHIQCEASFGCNLRCPFCGINGVFTEKREYHYMTLETAGKLAQRFADTGWTSRFEFAMRGEPTHNPNAPEIINLFRKAAPESYFLIETNGSGFLAANPKAVRDKIMRYFEAGLDTVAVDEYQNVPWAQSARNALKQSPLPKEIACYEYPKQSDGNPHHRQKSKRFVIIAPIDLASNGVHSDPCNHCGAGAPPNDKMAGKRCAFPFRGLVIHYDGHVPICCNDWRGVYKIGSALDTPWEELWQSDRYMAARRKLLYGQRDFGPCLGCDAHSYRVGFLPDSTGKHTMLPADEACERVIQEAIAGGSYAEPVLRPWERGDPGAGFVKIGGVVTRKLL
jgi:organic radical activating enzyme